MEQGMMPEKASAFTDNWPYTLNHIINQVQ